MKLIDAAKSKKFGIVRKLENYYAEYDFNFAGLQGKSLKILEIGIQRGGSLAMWQEYFPHASITGIDIDPSCAQFEQHGVSVHIGSQEDSEFLRSVEKNDGPFDIVIDDGGHTMKQQITTFHTLFPLLNENGIYVIEDIRTSYWREFGGGGIRTTTRLIKNLIDEIHYWASNNPRASIFLKIKNKLSPFKAIPKNVYQSSIRSIYIADSICFIHKQTLDKDVITKI